VRGQSGVNHIKYNHGVTKKREVFSVGYKLYPNLHNCSEVLLGADFTEMDDSLKGGFLPAPDFTLNPQKWLILLSEGNLYIPKAGSWLFACSCV